MGSPRRCQVPRPEGAGLGVGEASAPIHPCRTGSPLPASNKSSLEEALIVLTPRGCDLDVVFVHRVVGGFPV